MYGCMVLVWMQYSKKIIHYWLVIVLWLMIGLQGSVLASSNTLIIIGNYKSPIMKLSLGQIRSIFLGKTNKIDGQVVRGYNQPASSSIYSYFYSTIFQWTPRQVNRYWTSQVFGGEVAQPSTVANDKAAIELTSQYTGVIAYVSSRSLALSPYRDKIRVLYGKYNPIYNTGGYHSMDGLPAPPPLAGSETHSNQSTQSTSTSAPPQPTHTAPSPVASPSTSSSEVPASSQAPTSDLSDTGPGSSSLDVFSSSETGPIQKSVWESIIDDYHFNDYAQNTQVQKEKAAFLRNPKSLERMLRNATPYIGYVYQQVKKNKLPSEFALLPVIESGYDPFAYSRVGATGLWQMMPATAAGDYGLSIDWWYDQRRDILISTRAALSYLNVLHRSLGDWMLAAAAYNSGSGTVKKAIKFADKSGQSSNFWSLQLPKETRQYVPRLIAVAQIVKDAQKLGINLPKIADEPYFKVVTLRGQMDLGEISKLSGVSINQIRSLNPGMRRWATSPTGTFNLLLPKASVSTFQANLKSLDGKKQVSWQYHEVHSKESLATIAKDYHTTESFLKTINSLTSTTVTPGQGLLVPIRLNLSYQTGGVSLSSSESGDVSSLTVDDLLGNADQADGDIEKQMSQLKLNQEDPEKPTKTEPSQEDSSDDSLKQMISKIYGED